MAPRFNVSQRTTLLRPRDAPGSRLRPRMTLCDQEAIEEASLLEIPELERNLAVLGTVAIVSPLFGLLGTVTGMINAFTTIALEGTGDPQQLAGGISQALLTTAGGLTIAIPCLIFYQLFDSRVNRYMVEISQVSNEIINQLILGQSSDA